MSAAAERLARFRAGLGAAVTESRERAGLATRQVAAARASRAALEADFAARTAEFAERIRATAERHRDARTATPDAWAQELAIGELGETDQPATAAVAAPGKSAPRRRPPGDDPDLSEESWLA